MAAGSDVFKGQVYEVGEHYIPARDWPEDQSTVESLYRGGMFAERNWPQDLQDATRKWQARAIRYREKVNQEAIQRDREMAE